MRKAQPGLEPGKLPANLLESLLRSLPKNNPDVIKWPGIGEDAAVVDFSGQRLVFKTDPITFLSEDIFQYLITVNSNDIACMGGRPRYLLVTVLLPQGIARHDVRKMFAELKKACESRDVSLIGGHTEVTTGIDRIIAVGFMIGTLKGEPIGASGARPGDAILISKPIPIEAVSILARQVPDMLGLDQATLKKARDLIRKPGISVQMEAEIAAGLGATALHDPTEGGLATGLTELAKASGCGVEADLSSIPVHPIAGKIMSRLGIDPLGAISSGALIACCPQGKASLIIGSWKRKGIDGAVIGRMTESGLKLKVNGTLRPMPAFSTDELARFLSLQGARKQRSLQGKSRLPYRKPRLSPCNP